MDRPPTTADHILEVLADADGAWVGHSELREAIPGSYATLRTAVFRLKKARTIETEQHGAHTQYCTRCGQSTETTFYRTRR